MINKIILKKETAEAISEMAQQVHPKEVVGVIGGRKEDDKLVIDKLYYQPFNSDNYSAYITFNIPPGLDQVGTFHSHPGASYRPSSADKALFARQGFIHIIINNPYTLKNIHVFDQFGKELNFLLR